MNKVRAVELAREARETDFRDSRRMEVTVGCRNLSLGARASVSSLVVASVHHFHAIMTPYR
jgi:hypothetical protein